MIDTIPRPNASLDEFLAARARHASAGQLYTDAIAGILAAALVWYWRGAFWTLLLPFSIAVAAFGVWGVIDRLLAERPVGTRVRVVLKTVRVLVAVAGFGAGAFLLMVLLARSLGTIIS